MNFNDSDWNLFAKLCIILFTFDISTDFENENTTKTKKIARN